MGSDATQTDLRRSANGKYQAKVRLLTRNQLDKRSSAAAQFDAIAKSIAEDLGGEGHLSTIERHLVEAFAGVAIHVGHLNALLALGQQIDVIEHSQAISTMVRVASRIGIKRVLRDVTPEFQNYVKSYNDDETEQENE
jgi:hypothetical protein